MSVYCGRRFSAEELHQIKSLIEQQPKLKRTPLSREICTLLGWVRPNGALKDMTCRVALLRMQAEGLIKLPPSQNPQNGRRPPVPFTAATDAQPPLCRPVHELPPLTVQPVMTPAAARLWNEYIARYHYLGYTPLSGSQMRYEIFAGAQRVALISFGASAWKLAARERFIGWTEAQRQRNLPLVINNARFLVLPWIQSKGLASKILSLLARPSSPLSSFPSSPFPFTSSPSPPLLLSLPPPLPLPSGLAISLYVFVAIMLSVGYAIITAGTYSSSYSTYCTVRTCCVWSIVQYSIA